MSVLLNELALLEWRIQRMEAVFLRFVKTGIWAMRLYRRIGQFLLRTPLAGLSHRLMGSLAPEKQYQDWLMLHRAAHRQTNSPAGSEIAESNGPLISVVMPVFQPNLTWLRQAVDSIRNQSYGVWRLLIVLDGEPADDVRIYLEALPSADPRIQCILNEHGGISSALNRGLDCIQGSYTAFIGQDDFLEPSALHHVSVVIEREQPDLLYTDEGYVNEHGAPQLPLFKPAWSPALLLSCMYMGNLLVVDTAGAKAIGGFRSAHDGAQDYDLVLRLTDRGSSVVHVPQVLYHRREHAGSPALNHASRHSSHLAGSNALAQTLLRRSIHAEVVDGPAANTYRCSRIDSSDESAAIIIPTRNPKLLSRLLTSLDASRDRMQAEVHVVIHCQNNQVDAEIAGVCKRFGAQAIEYRGPFNFSLMNNLAAANLPNAFLVFLNDDVVVRGEHWLDGLCAPFLRPDVGIAGAQLVYPDGAIQHAGIVTGIGDGVGHSGRFQFGSPFWPWLGLTRNVSAVTGACLAVRRSVFATLNGFDTRYQNNYNDVDLCLRAQRAGFEVVVSCDVPLCHQEGRTRSPGTNLSERIAMWTEWGSVLAQADYFYSPNLSRKSETIDLASPTLR